MKESDFMNGKGFRFMRILVFFDLPVVKKDDLRHYTEFRRFLIKEGYDMIQFSVYSRLCNGYDSVERHLNLLKVNTPHKGSIRAMVITESQFVKMEILVGEKTKKEKKINTNALTLF